MSDLPTCELGHRPAGDHAWLWCDGIAGACRACDISEAQAETILNAVLDAGINYIDTSIDYGLSARRIGRTVTVIDSSAENL